MTKTAQEKKSLARHAKVLLDNHDFTMLYEAYVHDKRDEFFTTDPSATTEREALFLKVNTMADFMSYIKAATDEMV